MFILSYQGYKQMSTLMNLAEAAFAGFPHRGVTLFHPFAACTLKGKSPRPATLKEGGRRYVLSP